MALYNPRPFREEHPEALHAFIRQNSFATLVSQHEGQVVATHLPFMLDGDQGPQGTLVAHFARANPHWKHLTEAPDALVIFQGPHSYISPSWYASPVAVPTWNYAVVHVRGTAQIVHEAASLRAMVAALTTQNEVAQETPWDLHYVEDQIETNLKAIVGMVIPIETIEGKFKFNQNRSEADQRGVIPRLRLHP